MPPDRGLDTGDSEQWLFKQGDLLLGPVETKKLIELLYEGELDADTQVAPHGPVGAGAYRRLGELDAFRVHLAKAQAKQRVESQTVELRVRERKGRLLKVSVVGALGLALVLGGGRLAWWLALHRPWETQVQLPQPFIAEDDDLPTIKLASARAADEEFAYPEGPGATAAPGERARPAKPLEVKKPKEPVAAAPGTAVASLGTKRPKPTDDDVAVVQQWDQDAINSVVRQNKKTLHGCLSEEAQKHTAGWSAKIPIEFTIGNDGRVAKLWIDNPDFKSDGSELHKCMLATLRKWQFPRYEGEQANVSLSFSVGAR
ncbi:MAG: AgmX/PglI C-terminal domain-containing protein [Myxococcales bacterium]